MAKSTFKARPAGSIELAAEMLINLVGGLSAAANVPGCRVGRQALFTYTDRDEYSDRHMPVDVVRVLEREAGDPVVTRYLAAEAGHVLWRVDLPEDLQELSAQVAKVGKEVSDVFAELAADLADGKMTAREAGRAVNEIDEAIEALATLRAACAEKRDGGGEGRDGE